MKTKEKIFNGDVNVTLSNQKDWAKKLKDVTKINGDITLGENTTLKIESKNLTQTGDIIAYSGATITIPSMALTQTGDIIADSGATITIPSMALTQTGDIIAENNIELEKHLYPQTKEAKWYINEHSSDWLIEQNPVNAIYRLHDTEFKREWFIKIKNDELSAAEIFAIDNIEHRRIAYEFMDKIKMKELADFKVLDEVADDGHGFPMRIVSFTIQNMSEPLKFYNCFCPSSGREYFLGTDKNTCNEAKFCSFGLDEDEFVFVGEW
jgi:hypothetical protein